MGNFQHGCIIWNGNCKISVLISYRGNFGIFYLNCDVRDGDITFVHNFTGHLDGCLFKAKAKVKKTQLKISSSRAVLLTKDDLSHGMMNGLVCLS